MKINRRRVLAGLGAGTLAVGLGARPVRAAKIELTVAHGSPLKHVISAQGVEPWMQRVKELTGGDKVQCRSLFKEPIRFKPMFTMVLTCNHMPSVPPEDGGSWRRIRRVEFTSKFMDKPNPNNPREFQIDRELSQKFELWRETFMAMLLRYYKRYRAYGLKTPDIVMEYTNEYQRKNDVFADFCDNYLKKDPEGTVMVTQLFQLFREYCNADNIRKNIKKADFQESLEKRYGVCFNGGRAGMGWNGIKIVQPAPQVQPTKEVEDC